MQKKNILKSIGIVGAIVFLLIQFIQPNRENPASDPGLRIQAHLSVPDSVSEILKRACYDCHSNETHWPIYSYIAPASWLISYDVKEGRKELNFSEWGNYKTSRQGRKLSGIAVEVEDASMPLPKYVPLHPEARLSDSERQFIITWAKSEYTKLMGESDIED